MGFEGLGIWAQMEQQGIVQLMFIVEKNMKL